MGSGPVFDLSGKAHFSADSVIFVESAWPLYSLGPNKCYTIALLYDKIWNYFTLFYLVSTQKTETNFIT